jgi:hypothetical protein
MIFKDYGRRTLEYDFLPVVEIVQSDQSMYSLNVFFYPRVQTHIQKLYNP